MVKYTPAHLGGRHICAILNTARLLVSIHSHMESGRYVSVVFNVVALLVSIHFYQAGNGTAV